MTIKAYRKELTLVMTITMSYIHDHKFTFNDGVYMAIIDTESRAYKLVLTHLFFSPQ